MFEAIKYRRQLKKLDKQYFDTVNRYSEQRKKPNRTNEDLEISRSNENCDVSQIIEEIQSIKTKRFCKIADRLMVPLPDFKDEALWGRTDFGFGTILTDKGFWELKKLIRQEKRERREAFLAWLPLVTALTGLIGVIIGLVAVLNR
jgi:hypothetical protein